MAIAKDSGAGGSGKSYSNNLFDWAKKQQEERDKVIAAATAPKNNPSTSGGFNPYDYLSQIEQQRQQEIARIEQLRAQQQAELNAYKSNQIGGINNRFNETNAYLENLRRESELGIGANREKEQQANYIQNELYKSTMPQQLAAQGITGGASESALMGQNAAFQNQTSNTAQAYAKLLADAYAQSNAAKFQAEQAKADAIANIENQVYGQNYDMQNKFANSMSAAEKSYADLLASAQAKQYAPAQNNTAKPTEQSVYKNPYVTKQPDATPSSAQKTLSSEGINAGDYYGKRDPRILAFAAQLNMPNATDEEILRAAKSAGLF